MCFKGHDKVRRRKTAHGRIIPTTFESKCGWKGHLWKEKSRKDWKQETNPGLESVHTSYRTSLLDVDLQHPVFRKLENLVQDAESGRVLDFVQQYPEIESGQTVLELVKWV